jgi:hypothetical protein
MKEEKATGYIKVGVFSTEIIWGKKSFVFPNLGKRQTKNFRQGMFLFSMVRKDAAKFLLTKKVRTPKKYNSIEYNFDIGKIPENITGTDLNHAYWRIALKLGIISENTYEKGLDDKFKSTRLAVLSTMGRPKQYSIIKEGKIGEDLVIVQGDESLAKVYTLIRYTCFKYMNEIKDILGKDFLAYKTDCIYYVNTKQNKEKVEQYFSKKDLLMKQLS